MKRELSCVLGSSVLVATSYLASTSYLSRLPHLYQRLTPFKHVLIRRWIANMVVLNTKDHIDDTIVPIFQPRM